MAFAEFSRGIIRNKNKENVFLEEILNIDVMGYSSNLEKVRYEIRRMDTQLNEISRLNILLEEIQKSGSNVDIENIQIQEVAILERRIKELTLQMNEMTQTHNKEQAEKKSILNYTE